MKRFRALLIGLVVLCLMVPAFAQEAPAPLSGEELKAFSLSLLERAIADEGAVVRSEDGFMVEGIGYTLYLTSEDLSTDTVLSAADINMGSLHVEGFTGPRGIGASSSLEELLSAYPNDNPTLEGTMGSAVLYIDGQLPGPVALGQVVRDGQTIQLVEHSVYEQADNGYSRVGLQYLLQDGTVTNIRYFGGADLLSEQDAQQALEAAADLQEQNAYFAYGLVEPAPLTREDLSFAGMDFLDLTPEAAQAALGEVVHEEKVKDSTGEEIRTMQWDGVDISFIYDAKGELKHADRITVTVPGLEGPRGLRVGDQLSSVLGRFPHEGELPLNGGVLYGDNTGAEAPFGRLDMEDGGARLYLGVDVDGRRVLVSALFVNNALVEMSAGY